MRFKADITITESHREEMQGKSKGLTMKRGTEFFNLSVAECKKYNSQHSVADFLFIKTVHAIPCSREIEEY